MKTVIAIAGGGFSYGPKESPLLDLYILAQSQKDNPKICLLATGCGDNSNYIDYFKQVFKEYPCEPSHLSLFSPHTADFRSFLLEQDIIYVGPGHTKSMLMLWKGYGIDSILEEAYNQNIVMAGMSAGSVCWFDGCASDSIYGCLSPLPCLGLLKGISNCPHYENPERRPAFQSFIKDGQLPSGFAADDGVALHFIDGQFVRAVASKPKASAYKVDLVNDEIVETQIPKIFLGSKNNMTQYIFSQPPFVY